MEKKTYKVIINPYLAYCHLEDIEVKKKSDIEKYVEHLRRNGFTPTAQE